MKKLTNEEYINLEKKLDILLEKTQILVKDFKEIKVKIIGNNQEFDPEIHL